MKTENTELSRYIMLAGGQEKAAALLNCSQPAISQMKKLGVSKEMARGMVTAFPELSLYKLLYGDNNDSKRKAG